MTFHRRIVFAVGVTLLLTAMSVAGQDAKQMAIYQLKYEHAGCRGAGHLDAIRPEQR